tara:strand:- start:191 stop:430 length:240 start_codon:yes stop_codon:yes gene_type:complete
VAALVANSPVALERQDLAFVDSLGQQPKSAEIAVVTALAVVFPELCDCHQSRHDPYAGIDYDLYADGHRAVGHLCSAPM